MSKTLNEKLDELPPERKTKIKARANELIKEQAVPPVEDTANKTEVRIVSHGPFYDALQTGLVLSSATGLGVLALSALPASLFLYGGIMAFGIGSGYIMSLANHDLK